MKKVIIALSIIICLSAVSFVAHSEEAVNDTKRLYSAKTSEGHTIHFFGNEKSTNEKAFVMDNNNTVSAMAIALIKIANKEHNDKINKNEKNVGEIKKIIIIIK